MKLKRKTSLREVWLVSLLPAALVIIVSPAVPGPSGEIAAVERRLDQLGSGDAHQRVHSELRELSTQYSQNRQSLVELESREAELQKYIEELRLPVASGKLNMAEGLDEMTRRLAAHGVQVLAMVEEGSRRHVGSAAPSRKTGTAAQQQWRVSVAATWPVVRAALADVEAFPPGLVLLAMQMHPPQSNVPLQRWELIVADSGTSP